MKQQQRVPGEILIIGLIIGPVSAATSRASPTGPRHVCDICIFLRTFPQTRHRASSVFCLQRGEEYRPSDSFLFRLKRRLGCWAQPPEQNFAMSIIYNWHVLQQLTAAQFTDEKLWRGSASKVPTLPRHTSCVRFANRSFEPVLSIGTIRRACVSRIGEVRFISWPLIWRALYKIHWLRSTSGFGGSV